MANGLVNRAAVRRLALEQGRRIGGRALEALEERLERTVVRACQQVTMGGTVRRANVELGVAPNARR